MYRLADHPPARALLHSRYLTRLVTLVFVAGCGAWYLQENVLTRIPGGRPSDFSWYYLAAGHVARGESPYWAEGYIYLPLLSFLLVSLTRVDYVNARIIWFAFSQLCLLTSAVLVWRRAGKDQLAACAVAFIWAAGGAAGETLSLGQVTPVLVLLLSLVYSESGWAQGASIGAGIALKLIPGILLPIPILRRSWSAVVALIITTLLLAVGPWLAVPAFYPGPAQPALHRFLTGTPAILSWSAPSVALRVLDPPKGGEVPRSWIEGQNLQTLQVPKQHQWLAVALSILTIALGCGALVFVTRGRLTPEQTPLAAAALIAFGLAASPVAWTHYQVLQYPGVAILFCYAVRARLWRILAGTVICASLLYPLPVSVLRMFYNRAHAWPNAPAVLYFWTTIPVLASLVLSGIMMFCLLHMGLREEKGDVL